MENQVIVQRYVLRVISRLIYHLTIFRVDVERIQQLQLIPRLVKVMQARGELAGEVYLEIAQVIVNAVIKSSKLTFSLLNELKQANGISSLSLMLCSTARSSRGALCVPRPLDGQACDRRGQRRLCDRAVATGLCRAAARLRH